MAIAAEPGMLETIRQCPKCGHVMPQSMPASSQCHVYGIYFFKLGQSMPPPRSAAKDETSGGLFQMLLQPGKELDAPAFYGRMITLLVLSYWSWVLIRCDYRNGQIFKSFMHNILLPIHEAGHVFLMPFGEFMTILGGSLFQLALPFAIGVAFVVKNHDNFATAICLWWTSISLLDLAPYIYDSLHPQLALLGGYTGDDGPHDWIYLLGVFGQIPHAQHWGTVAHALGTGAAVVSLNWAAIVLTRQCE